jgi:hypothetical protein
MFDVVIKHRFGHVCDWVTWLLQHAAGIEGRVQFTMWFVCLSVNQGQDCSHHQC